MGTIAVRVKPGAARAKVGGRYDGPHGPALIVAVTARPVDGKATAAVLRAVAAALGLRAATLTVRVGSVARDKILAVTDPPPDLDVRVARLRDVP